MTRVSFPRCAAVLIGAIGLLAVNARTAAAADFCMGYFRVGPMEDEIIVGKHFRVPAPGRCKPFMGFMRLQFGGSSEDVTGSACTASNGSHVRFVLTTSRASKGYNATSTIQATLPLPLGPGGWLYRTYTGSNSGQSFDESVSHRPCSPSLRQVP